MGQYVQNSTLSVVKSEIISTVVEENSAVEVTLSTAISFYGLEFNSTISTTFSDLDSLYLSTLSNFESQLDINLSITTSTTDDRSDSVLSDITSLAVSTAVEVSSLASFAVSDVSAEVSSLQSIETRFSGANSVLESLAIDTESIGVLLDTDGSEASSIADLETSSGGSYLSAYMDNGPLGSTGHYHKRWVGMVPKSDSIASNATTLDLAEQSTQWHQTYSGAVSNASYLSHVFMSGLIYAGGFDSPFAGLYDDFHISALRLFGEISIVTDWASGGLASATIEVNLSQTNHSVVLQSTWSFDADELFVLPGQFPLELENTSWYEPSNPIAVSVWFIITNEGTVTDLAVYLKKTAHMEYYLDVSFPV